MKTYDLSESSFIALTEALVKSKKVKAGSNQVKGYAFNSLDEIHPAWAPFLAMARKSDKDGMILSKIHPKHEYIVSLQQYIDMHKRPEAKKYFEFWNLHYVDIWAPFAEFTPNSTKNSLEQWSQIEKKLSINTEQYIKQGVPSDKIEELKRDSYAFFQSIFTYHGELYANSKTHGFHRDETLNQRTLMSSFVSISSMDKKSLEIKLFHADYGMQFFENLKLRKSSLFEKMTPQEAIKWSLMTGNSSKDENEYPIRGLGSAMIKSLIAFHDSSSGICYTGNYIIRFIKKIENFTEDKIKFYIKDGIINHIDDLVNVTVEYTKEKFPGTAWLVSIKVDSIDDIKEHEEIKVIMQEKQKAEQDFIKEFIYVKKN